MKISRKLILAFTSIALLSALAGYVSIKSSQKALQESIGRESTAFAAKILKQIERQIYGRVEQLQTYALDRAFQKQLAESNRRFDEMENVSEYIGKTDSEWTSAPKETVSSFMKKIIHNDLSKKIRKEMEMKDFYKAKYGYPVFAEIFVTNKYGANVAQTQKTSDYYQADEQWWQRAKTDGLHVDDIAFDESADVYSLNVGLRIDDKAGGFSGVLLAVINIKEVINIVKEAHKSSGYNTAEFKLLTRQSRVIYSTDEYAIFENMPEEFFNNLHEKDRRGHKNHFISTGAEPEDEKKLLAYAHSKGYKDYKGSGWMLAAELEAGEIFAPVVRLRNRLLAISLAITVFAVSLGLIISKSISKPIFKLTQAAEIMSRDMDHRVEIKSRDEVGILANSFNHMADKLSESHQKLEEEVRQRTAELEETLKGASQRAGMAEVASDVLHNVKNVLNSINVAASKMNEAVSRSEVSNLQKVAEMIKEHDQDLGTFLTQDRKGKHVPTFLIELSKTLAEEQADTTDKLRSLTENIKHIKEIISMQQSYAKVSGAEVSISLDELMDNAVSINRSGLERHGVEVVCDFEDDIGVVNINSQKVLQILVNLIKNAKQALEQKEDGNKVLTVRTRKNGDDKIQIEVADNGEGISQENLSKLFSHGFTTKEYGHGFGLHGGYLTAAELGGSLTAHSQGEGEGATFILELPFKPIEVVL
ncbi:MAG: ATP-binding protein [Planctomycetota bacterium]|jgi:signal transduction histidine kinase